MKSEDIELIKDSGLFDENWYKEQYSDVQITGMDPIEHYLWIGARIGRDPSPLFSSQDYTSVYADVAAAGMNPLIHYIRFGKAEGRKFLPSWLTRRIYRKSRYSDGRKRVAIFAVYSDSGFITDNILIYLSRLTEIADHIIFVADNNFSDAVLTRVRHFTRHLIVGRHGEYDFGSYKRGINYAKEQGLFYDADELILCNDSCYGPIGGFRRIFNSMNTRKCEFWGVTANIQFQPHIQSYFVVFKRPVFLDPEFQLFFNGVETKKNVSEVVMSYEVPMTRHFESLGFEWDTFINNDTPEYSSLQKINPNFTVRPLYLLEHGCPIVKVKAFKKTNCNHDGIIPSLNRVRAQDEGVYAAIMEHAGPEAFFAIPKVEFSIIVPFYNRAPKLQSAVQSVLQQDHRNFELILIDDGSTDGASDMIRSRFFSEIQSGKIVLIRQPQRSGVSAARNVGLKVAKKPWIAYLDSDNQLKTNFLSTFASSIVENPSHKTFYSYFKRQPSGKIHGQHYNRANLLAANYIDLGAFVHAKEVYQKNLGFDENLRRLVDWDLIIRYTEKNPPVCITIPLIEYWDNDKDTSRISVSESLDDARIAIRLKYRMPFRVTTIIPTYNHRDFIEHAVLSAIEQKGHFKHEILLCDDFSTDGTREIVSGLALKYRGLVRNVRNSENLGISKTFKRCIDLASGDFIAILEGDDVWTDKQKLERQINFLAENNDCSMVFSKIRVRSLPSGKERFLQRQDVIKKQKVDGDDFLAHPSMNLIANFSSCLFKAGLLKSSPERLFQGRFNEIAVAFYMERHGKIGFINEPMSIYHQHVKGVWSGSNQEQQLRSGIETREMVLDIAHPKYRERILEIIEKRYREPLSEFLGHI
ncbi:glycosyltransferase [Rhizobiaceae bacterium BDR2-2]|uniref:Glycosyltransferase n=1 Tax=Ectorhizobium quercum TaxID=2965071 RepID=A0AAE3STJ8_9HYPH|nr:glycosyltransferase [Ectorhizobium quercum]MCX8996200.1 glycosyltransferase [Ectorhizobium quercum]MCX8998761.1 glycosyltransferase [Ectorhizobium quercum]